MKLNVSLFCKKMFINKRCQIMYFNLNFCCQYFSKKAGINSSVACFKAYLEKVTNLIFVHFEDKY